MWAFQLPMEDLNTDERRGDNESAYRTQPTPMADDSSTFADLQGLNLINHVLFFNVQPGKLIGFFGQIEVPLKRIHAWTSYFGHFALLFGPFLIL